jgi:catechol 2,3-dioxygenase-like lactoylglutathione lyase family enzyme
MRTALGLIAACVALLHGAQLLAQTPCARADLNAAVEGYLAAQGRGEPAALPMASAAQYVENAQEAPLAQSIVARALKIDFHRSLLDVATCQTFTEVIVADPVHPYVLGVREQLKDGRVSELETLVTQRKDWLFSAASDLKYSPQEDWGELAPAARTSRAGLIAAANAYFDLFMDKRVQVPWGTPCNRLEGGLRTGKGQADDSCNVGVPSGVRLAARRFIVDEDIGAVVGLVRFGGEEGLPDSHLFRVADGRIRYVHTITVCSIPNCGFPLPKPLLAERGAYGQVLGIALVGRMVRDLDRSIAFYRALGFTPDSSAAPAWHRDPTAAHLYGLKNVELRSVRMAVIDATSGKPFTLELTQLRGLVRANRAQHTAWDPGVSHFGLVVTDAAALWSQLKARGELHARSWGAQLVAPPGQTKGLLAYITDPDGLDIELVDQRPAVPAAEGRPAQRGFQPGVSHVGLVDLDSDRARAFYGELLGAQPLYAPAPWLRGDFFDSAVGGHGNVLRIFIDSFAEAAAPRAQMNFELVDFQNRKRPVDGARISDVGVGYVGFEVAGLAALVARLQAAGAQRISESAGDSGPNAITAVMLRDPDVGGFIELIERPPEARSP